MIRGGYDEKVQVVIDKNIVWEVFEYHVVFGKSYNSDIIMRYAIILGFLAEVI